MIKTICIYGMIGCSLSLFSCKKETKQASIVEKPRIEMNTPKIVQEKSTSKIQLAILLDTSNSMDGLIEQAKNQLWKIVNQLAKAKSNTNEDPIIEIALYQYGNDGLSAFNDYIEKQSGFTGELDEISEKLFNLKTNGGEEYCGAVIETSIKDLKWSNQPNDLQMIFIAGNEPFDQGGVNYKNAINQAVKNNVIVNTIFCGDSRLGISGFWKNAANLGNGKHMNINQDVKTVHIDSPYDTEILELNTRLNSTYIPYGKQGLSKKEKQIAQDINASSYGIANVVKRTLSKSSKVYKNSNWDLIDASTEKEIDLSKLEKKELPKEIRNLSETQLKSYINNKAKERDSIKKSLNELRKKRGKFVEKENQKKDKSSLLDDAIISTITEQAKNKGYSFSE